MTGPHIVCDNVGFRYANAEVATVKNVNLRIEAGTCVVFTGPSGCGKTTLARCINGLAPQFWNGELTGSITIDGHDLSTMTIGHIGDRVGSVFQNPRSQFFMTTTRSELSFGCAQRGVPLRIINERMSRTFSDLRLEHLSQRSLFRLSSGQLQQIAIGSVYTSSPQVYVFDEPSANLDHAATMRLAAVMKVLKSHGATLLVFEHRLFYLTDLLDQLLVLKDGTIDARYNRRDLAEFTPENVATIGLRCLTLDHLRTQKATNQRHFEQKNSFEIADISLQRKAHDQADSFTLGPITASAHAGQIIGLTGDNGAGKTTLARLCAGLEKENGGTITVAGRQLDRRRRRGRIRLIMQDSDYQLFADSVIAELSMAHKQPPRNLIDILHKLGLNRLEEIHPQALSRGQQQRLTIACALVDEADVFFFDEPTSGLDATSMRAVSDLIAGLAEEGRIVFLISHDLELLSSTATHIWHLVDGKLDGVYPLTNATLPRLLNQFMPVGEQP